MPIVVDVFSDPRIGPGSFFTLTTDFIGPIPLEWRWHFQVLADGEGLAWISSTQSDGTHARSGIVAAPGSGWALTHTPGVFPPNGSTVTVQAQLLDEGFEVQDEGIRTDLTWTTQGDFQRELNTPTGTGGVLTDTQAAQLATIASATTASFDITAGSPLVQGLSSLVVHPPLFLIEPVGDPELLTGRGELTHPFGPIPVAAFGLQTSFFTIPSGFGFRDGVILEYQQRIVQFAALHLMHDGTTEVLSEVLDLNYEGYLWLWANPFPTRILYDVTPGCAVVVRWMGL